MGIVEPFDDRGGRLKQSMADKLEKFYDELAAKEAEHAEGRTGPTEEERLHRGVQARIVEREKLITEDRR